MQDSALSSPIVDRWLESSCIIDSHCITQSMCIGCISMYAVAATTVGGWKPRSQAAEEPPPAFERGPLLRAILMPISSCIISPNPSHKFFIINIQVYSSRILSTFKHLQHQVSSRSGAPKLAFKSSRAERDLIARKREFSHEFFRCVS